MTLAVQPWERTLVRWCTEAMQPGHDVLDVGGGLRAVRGRGNRMDPERARWAEPLVLRCRYRILDPVDTYHPDVVGDVRALPLADESLDAVLCLSVLEHVDDPFAAMREMRRVLRVGGLLVLHVPFLYPYHAQPGYYGDFFRFTEEGVRVLGRAFSQCDIEPTGGRLAATAVVSPLARFGPLRRAADSLDAALTAWRASVSPQARGYLARLVR